MNDLSEKIAASLLDDLTPEERAELDRHLAADPEAAALAAELTAMNDQLAAHHRAHAAAPTLEQRMVAGFRSARSRTTLASRLRAWFRLPAIYLPATAAVLVGMVQLGSRLTDEPLSRPQLGAAPLAPETRRDGALMQTVSEPGGPFVATESADYEFSGVRTSVLDKMERQSGETPASAPLNETRSRMLGSKDDSLGTSVVDSIAQAPVSPVTAGRNKDAVREQFFVQSAPAQQQAGSSKTAESPSAPAAPTRKLIRNATTEVEVTNFDNATQAVTNAARAAGGYVATQNSSRQPNGKMSGAIVIKIPPGALDGFLAQLRTLGEVRNQTIGSQDVTKAYFDTEARLKNARVMEQRLVELLRDTKGKVSDLLEVERELGRVREQIEQMQGELKLWDSLVAFATVTVQLFEKDMNEAAAYLLRERATLALVSADVEAAFEQAKSVAGESNAQITQSNLTRNAPDQATAVLALLLDPESADAAIERLKAIGNVLDFRVETERVARDGSADAPNARIERDRVQVAMTIRSQDESPAQRTRLRLETNQVEQEVAALRDFAAKNAIEVRDSTFEQLPDGRQTASLRFLLPLASNETLLARIGESGVVKDLTVQRNDTAQPANVTPRAEIALHVTTPPRLVADSNSLPATLHRTFSQAVGALMWSVRMIGVSLAFLAPWLLAIAVLFLAIVRIRRARR